MSCQRADEIVALAKTYGWQTRVASTHNEASEHVDVQLSSDWGLDGAPVWSWGVMLRWYRSDFRDTGRWRLGEVNGHSVVGVFIGPDNVEREFWLRSLKALRECIIEPALLVEVFEGSMA